MTQPRIDIHAHTFNANDIPIRGFIQRTDIPFVPRFVERLLMGLIGRLVDKYFDLTTDKELAFKLDPELRATPTPRTLLAALESDPEAEALLSELELILAPSNSTLSSTQREELRSWAADELDPDEAWANDEPEGLSLGGSYLARKIAGRLVKKYVRWLRILKSSHNEIADSIVATYPKTDLFVTHLLDMDKWLPGTAENDLDERLDNALDLTIRMQGRIHPFAPFDPRHALEVGVTKYLDRISHHIDESGFVGIKIYPPMGFRPSDNGNTAPRLDNPQGYDNALKTLFEYCVAHEVPLTAHCTPKGAQSDPSRSTGLNSNPRHWRSTLEDFPTLRVNLAHFGGMEELTNGDASNWSTEILSLMRSFPHVYADCGHHGIHKKKIRKKAVEALKSMYSDSPLQDRFMFGSDWHMIVRNGKEDRFPSAYEGIINRMKLQNPGEARSKFFGANAAEYLNLSSPGKARDRLANFYKVQQISAPSWFTGPTA